MSDLAIRDIDGWQVDTTQSEEPRVRDVELAERLGISQARDIRKLIERNREELEGYGEICMRATVTRIEKPSRGVEERVVTEFWLNEGQALCLGAMSRAQRAPEVRRQLIAVYQKARRQVPMMLGLAEALQAGFAPLVEGLRETNAQIAESNRAIGALTLGQTGLAQRVTGLEAKVDFIARSRRRNLSLATKDAHIFALRAMGGRCPCCRTADVLNVDGERLLGAEFDHFFANSAADVEHTWLICGDCHRSLTNGEATRDQRETEFGAYQSARRRVPGGQGRLF
jgi:hypothetical protein